MRIAVRLSARVPKLGKTSKRRAAATATGSRNNQPRTEAVVDIGVAFERGASHMTTPTIAAVCAWALAASIPNLRAAAIIETFGSEPNAFSIAFVDIGNPGNADDAGAGGGSSSSSSREATGTVLQFEGVAAAENLINVSPASPYSESSFTLTPTNDRSAVFDSAAPTQMPGNSTDFFGFAESNTITLTRDGLMPFNLLSLDVGLSTAAINPSITMTLIGSVNGGGSMSTQFSGISSSTTKVLNWSNLSSVVISSSDDSAIDNINVVPEPASILLLLGAAGAVGLLQRRPMWSQ